ncbi:MAG TPA: glycoside hydrolase family 15 protein [Nitrospirales bacterium]
MRIEDYALIGDTQSAALVGRNGSIDWLCLPRFDSGACFAALLGDQHHGRWLLSPRNDVRRTQRRYRPGTLILETEFETDEGTVRVVDCMPPREKEPDVVRMVCGVRGRVRMRMELVIRFDYGRTIPWVQNLRGAIHAVAGPDAVILYTPVATHGEGLTTVAEFVVDEGQQVPFVLVWHPSHLPPPEPIEAASAIEDSQTWWSNWSDRCTHTGEWREEVVRSLITLKALTYAPTGGIVAAATTSLPEALGGVRNWDYRYCWIRDATFTLYALMTAGYTEEAAAWRDWLLRSVAGDPAQLQIMYGPGGERRLTEIELPWLPGYEESSPVRIGNAAVDQFQLDVYGEVMDTLHQARRVGIEEDGFAWALQKHLLDFLESGWKDPDEGIWEVRGPRRHFTHSKVMAWVAVDRAVKDMERYHLLSEDLHALDHWKRLRGEIHEQVCTLGYDSHRRTFTQFYGTSDLDASLLMIPLVGFLPATDERMRGTVEAIEQELCRDGFVLRYRTKEMGPVDGLPAGEGAFLACTFWLADNYALMGRHAEARTIFERLLKVCNDVGLLSEQYDPHAKRLLGNFPQAFSHVSLINTARNLSREASGAVHPRAANPSEPREA